MNNDFNLNSTSIIKKLWEKRKLLLIVGVFAFLVSIVTTLMMPNKYEATAVVMPPIANQASKELFTSALQEGLTVFGESDEVEHLQQIITSRTLKDLVIDRLNLWNLWSINPETPHAKNLMYLAFNKAVRVKSTQFQGVMISVRDNSPELATIIANTIVDFSDSLLREVKQQVAQKALLAYEKQYNLELESITALQDSMRKVMVAGVTSPDMQSKELTKAYISAVAGGNENYINKISRQFDPIKQHGSKFIRYNYELEYATENIVMLGNYLRVLRIEAEQEIPSQFVIDRAVVSDNKISPKRTILVAISTLASIFFAIFTIILLEFFSAIMSKKE